MSKLNCRPGDLAVIVRSAAGNEGKIVQCIELDRFMRWQSLGGKEWTAPGWRVDQVLRGTGGTPDNWIEDSLLRPIRDPGEDAQDETLLWIPVPSASKEVA